VWNLVDLATYGLQIAISTMHLGRIGSTSSLLTGMMSAQCVLLFFRLNYFSRLFANRFSFLDSLKQVGGLEVELWAVALVLLWIWIRIWIWP